MQINLSILLQGFGVVWPLILLGAALIKRRVRTELALWLHGLLVIYLLIPLVHILPFVPGNFVDSLPRGLNTYWFLFGIFIGSIIIRNLGDGLSRRMIRFVPWNLIGLVWLVLCLGVLVASYYPAFLTLVDRWDVQVSQSIYWALLAGWIFFTLITLLSLVKNYRQYRFPTLRNRIIMWGMALAILILGNVLGIFQQEVPGAIFAALGLFGITEIIQTPRLPHLGITIRRALNSLIGFGLEFGLFFLLIYGVQFSFVNVFNIHALAAAAVVSLAIIVLINPILKRCIQWLDGLFFGEEQDVKAVLREFSQKISNILDLELLSAVVVDLVRDLLDVERGLLFLVELEVGPTGEKQYQFKHGPKKRDNPQIATLPSDSPLAQSWDMHRQTLTQAEIEMLPLFNSLKSNTLRWLNHLEMDVYVPIHAQDEWVGLLALGPKSSGASYYSDDIELLDTLADQTAVAMQNARLVESLMRVNKEFRKAYASMDDAHTKLQKIDRTKSDFISIASHELRTPLTILSGYSQMLMDAPDLKENPIYSDAAKGVFEGSQRLHEIVDSMLDVAKIDMQDLALQSEPVFLHDVIRNASRDFSDTLAERKLTLETADSLKRLPCVEGDSAALQKVFRHIMSNAVKYTPDGGTISIDGAEIPEGDPKSPQGGVEVVVKDSGIGIDARYIDLIFTKFYQTGDVDLHSSGKTKFKGGGPGLGLAIVRGIVTALGGRVWAESPGYDEEKNPGSSFHVILPCSDSDEFIFPPL